MTPVWTRMLEAIDAQGAAALVSVVATAGSVPREAGARMVLRPDGGFWGTVGGGSLEWALIGEAGSALAAVDHAAPEGRGTLREWPLGPDLGQCCGGRVTTLLETYGRGARPRVAEWAAREAAGRFDSHVRLGADGIVLRTVAGEADSISHGPGSSGPFAERFGDERTPLLLFGAGHVGRALAQALAPLPFRLRWIETREGAFPSVVPTNAEAVLTADPEAELRRAVPGSMVVLMTHSHPLDLALTAAALSRGDFRFVGLIGSGTKRARFLSRMRSLGLPDQRLSALVCPIGVPGLGGKEPAVIAASVAVQLLQVREAGQGEVAKPSRAARRAAG